jgi:hypothetical protein
MDVVQLTRSEPGSNINDCAAWSWSDEAVAAPVENMTAGGTSIETGGKPVEEMPNDPI